eukprot:XP_001692173.1 predicted protein [Chlamydomonas reinhardtii]
MARRSCQLRGRRWPQQIARAAPPLRPRRRPLLPPLRWGRRARARRPRRRPRCGRRTPSTAPAAPGSNWAAPEASRAAVRLARPPSAK